MRIYEEFLNVNDQYWVSLFLNGNCNKYSLANKDTMTKTFKGRKIRFKKFVIILKSWICFSCSCFVIIGIINLLTLNSYNFTRFIIVISCLERIFDTFAFFPNTKHLHMTPQLTAELMIGTRSFWSVCIFSKVLKMPLLIIVNF